jgi:hypothetical protein
VLLPDPEPPLNPMITGFVMRGPTILLFKWVSRA